MYVCMCVYICVYIYIYIHIYIYIYTHIKDATLRRLAFEYELVGDIARAKTLFKERRRENIVGVNMVLA